MVPSIDLTAASIIPSELTGPLPRRTRISANGILSTIAPAVFLVGAVALSFRPGMNAMRETQIRAALLDVSSDALGGMPLIGSMMLVLMSVAVLISMRIDRRLVAEGAPAVAVIRDCSSGGRGGFRVKYEFRTEDGRVMNGSGKSDSPQEIGASICVLYLLRDPKRNRPYQSLNYRVAQ